MRRVLIAASTISAAGLLLVSAATANRPTHSEGSGPLDFVISNVCEFDVHVQGTDGGKSVVFADRVNIIEHATVRLTNLSDPSKSIDLQLSSPEHITENPDGSSIIRFDGPHFLAHEADEPPGAPAQMFLVKGQATWTFDADGHLVGEDLPNNRTDLCAALA